MNGNVCKFENCRFKKPFIRKESVIWKCLNENNKFKETIINNDGEEQNYPIVDKTYCENCELYKSKYVEFPLVVENIVVDNDVTKESLENIECGELVAVRLCDKNDKETYLGIYLGDLAYMNTYSFNEKSKELHFFPVCNPAIFVPKLKKIVFGLECFWYELDNEEQFKDITDKDIDEYAKFIKTMLSFNL